MPSAMLRVVRGRSLFQSIPHGGEHLSRVVIENVFTPASDPDANAVLVLRAQELRLSPPKAEVAGGLNNLALIDDEFAARVRLHDLSVLAEDECLVFHARAVARRPGT